MTLLRTLAAAVIFSVILVSFFDWALNSRIEILGFEPERQANNARPIWSSVALAAGGMLIGILFGTVYERIRDRQRVSLPREIRRALNSAQFAATLLIAPLLFAGVYSAARAEPDIVAATFFAFQNGFFCDRIVNMREAPGSSGSP